MTFAEFEQAVEEARLSARECTTHHWQIRNGKVLVNYYPTTGVIYVDRAEAGIKGSVEKAIRIARSG